jgi:hypothetical protein
MLFGHLVARFSTHPENLATEAVAFIVNRSAAMREALRRLVGRTGIELPSLARFCSQAGDEQGNIPDLVGLDAMGTERLLIENKFWAGLTVNQPAGYLERLPAEGGAVLIFVVPSKRLPIVWTELASSAMNRSTRLPNPEQLAGDLLFARLTSSTALAATTWNAVLDSIEAAARTSGEASAAADIAQLRSLCDVMDNEAFLPVRMAELTNLDVPRRMIGLADLIPDLSQLAVAAGIAIIKGLMPTHGWHSAGAIPQDRPSRGMAGHRPREMVALRHYSSLDLVLPHPRIRPRPIRAGSLEGVGPTAIIRRERLRPYPAYRLTRSHARKGTGGPARAASALARRARRCSAALIGDRSSDALDHSLLKPRAAAFLGKSTPIARERRCQRRVSTYRRFLQRSAFSCRVPMPGDQGNMPRVPMVVLVGVRGFEPPAPASR